MHNPGRQDPGRHDREWRDSLLRAHLVAHLARRLRPACVGVRRHDFLTFVAAVVALQMQAYAAVPPS